MKELLEITGLREKPQNGNVEQPYHMTSVLKRLFPYNTPRVGKGLVDMNGNGVYKKIGTKIFPDFLYIDLKLIIEIDGDGINRKDGHFTCKKKAENDKWKYEQYKNLGYTVIAIPPYIQLDEIMIKYYFNIDYPDLLYPAAKEHGFAHPDIPLPTNFCKLGLDRFIEDLNSFPAAIKRKIIDTLDRRVKDFKNEGFSDDDALSKVLPPSIQYLLKDVATGNRKR